MGQGRGEDDSTVDHFAAVAGGHLAARELRALRRATEAVGRRARAALDRTFHTTRVGWQCRATLPYGRAMHLVTGPDPVVRILSLVSDHLVEVLANGDIDDESRDRLSRVVRALRCNARISAAATGP
jgi:hypothetical protein